MIDEEENEQPSNQQDHEQDYDDYEAGRLAEENLVSRMERPDIEEKTEEKKQQQSGSSSS